MPHTMRGRKKFFTLSFIVTLTSILAAVEDAGANLCPHHVTKLPRSYTTTHNHICYLFVNNELFWSKAREICWDLGGEMLYIDSQDTMDFIKKKLNSPELSWDRNGVWLGASNVNGRWIWTNGRAMNYTNWAPGQPSNLLGILSVENCSQMRQENGWKWHDIPCGSLKFHYNYVCQFPAVEATATTTLTSTTTLSSHISSSRASFYRIHSGLNSEEFRRLEEEFFRILNGHVLSIYHSTLHPNSNPPALNKPGDVAGRVSSLAADQTEDNGNSVILSIIIGVSTGLILIMGVIFLTLYIHQRRNRLKTNESAVHFCTNTYHRSPVGLIVPNSQALAIPTNQATFSSNEELYLEPQQDDNHQDQMLNASLSQKGCSCNQNHMGATSSVCSSPETNSELGACGGSDPEQELKVPLMDSSNKIICDQVGANCVAHSPQHSCCSHNQGGYIDMNSTAQEKKKYRHAKEEDEKHTYSNVDHRDSGIENLYEVLP